MINKHDIQAAYYRVRLDLADLWDSIKEEGKIGLFRILREEQWGARYIYLVILLPLFLLYSAWGIGHHGYFVFCGVFTLMTWFYIFARHWLKFTGAGYLPSHERPFVVSLLYVSLMFSLLSYLLLELLLFAKPFDLPEGLVEKYTFIGIVATLAVAIIIERVGVVRSFLILPIGAALLYFGYLAVTSEALKAASSPGVPHLRVLKQHECVTVLFAQTPHHTSINGYGWFRLTGDKPITCWKFLHSSSTSTGDPQWRNIRVGTEFGGKLVQTIKTDGEWVFRADDRAECVPVHLTICRLDSPNP